MRHVSSRSCVATLRTAIHLLLTFLPDRISRITDCNFTVRMLYRNMYWLLYIYFRPALCFILVYNCGLTVRSKRINYVMLIDLICDACIFQLRNERSGGVEHNHWSFVQWCVGLSVRHLPGPARVIPACSRQKITTGRILSRAYCSTQTPPSRGERKCAKNYNKWHNKFIGLDCSQHVGNNTTTTTTTTTV